MVGRTLRGSLSAGSLSTGKGRGGYHPAIMIHRILLAGIASALLFACSSTPPALPNGDPTVGEVPLPAAEGWGARLLFDNEGVGIWTVKARQLFEQYACPEVIGLDNDGRCNVLISYSGKWSRLEVVDDLGWLGALHHSDVDPRFDGAELYVGGQRGHLFQILAYPQGILDARLIAAFPGYEVHSVIGGELDPATPGRELLVFTRPGALWRVTPSAADGCWDVELVEVLPGRVRDVALLPDDGKGAPRIATVARSGALRILRFEQGRPTWTTLHEEEMGMGRIAVREPGGNEPLVLYASLDDGRVLRFEERADGWHSEPIYIGPQGVRGIAVGRFAADPDRETVAVFGYSGKIELLSRKRKGWTAETIFIDLDQGHWLEAAELDGRNATDELVGSGYGGRVVMLVRPPGFGIGGDEKEEE